MNTIQPKISITSGNWDTADTTVLITAVVLGAIALTAGTLGILGHQGVSLGAFNVISTKFPLACSALVGAIGGALILSCLCVTGVKTMKSKMFHSRFTKNEEEKKKLDNRGNYPFEEKKYHVVFDEENLHFASNHFRIFLKDAVYVYGSIEQFAAKIKDLEKIGYTNVEKVRDVQPVYSYLDSPEESSKGHPKMYWLGLTITLISLPAFIVPFFCPFPYAWTVQTAALGVLTAVAYGIINDQFALRQSKHYFTLGHTSIHKRLLKTDNPTANGCIWGIYATWELGAIAGVVLALVATVTHSCAINPLYLTPLSLGGSLAAGLYSHFKSKNKERAYSLPLIKSTVDTYFNCNKIEPQKGYDRVYLRNVPKEERAGWLAIDDRNAIGYAVMPTLGAVLLVSIIAARVLLAVV